MTLWYFRKGPNSKSIHESCFSRTSTDSSGVEFSDEGVEKGGLADVGGAEDEDLGDVLVFGVVAEGFGGVEELEVLLEEGCCGGDLGVLGFCGCCGER